MKDLVILLVHLLTAVARLLGPGGTRALVAENLLIKQQLLILTRFRQRAPNLTPRDRILLGFWSLFLRPARFHKVAVALRAATLLAFHQCLVRRKYCALFSSSRHRKLGPKGPSEELVRVIVELKRRNPRFGCPRIALIIARTFGVEIDKDVVRRVLAKHYRPEPGAGGPSWLTIIGFGIHTGAVDGIELCWMFNHAIARQDVPHYLSTDHDPLFEFHRWKANLRVLEVDELKTVPYTPTSHPFVERLIGTIRREFLDHALFWNSVDLESKLSEFRDYFNSERVHRGIDGATPFEIGGGSRLQPADLNSFRWQTACRGLYALPAAA